MFSSNEYMKPIYDVNITNSQNNQNNQNNNNNNDKNIYICYNCTQYQSTIPHIPLNNPEKLLLYDIDNSCNLSSISIDKINIPHINNTSDNFINGTINIMFPMRRSIDSWNYHIEAIEVSYSSLVLLTTVILTSSLFNIDFIKRINTLS